MLKSTDLGKYISPYSKKTLGAVGGLVEEKDIEKAKAELKR
jgi:hypothetical protein